MNERSVDTIMNWLTTTVASKLPVPPEQFIEAAQYLVILIGDEQTKLYALEQEVAKIRLEKLAESSSVAEAKLKVEVVDKYREMRQQQAKIKQIDEMVRIAKLMGKMKNNEYMNH